MIGGLAVATPPPATAADDGLVVVAQTRYQVLPADHRVHVTIDAVATSLEPDTPQGQIYYSGITFAVPAGATNIAAASGGRPIGARARSTDDDFTLIEVTFGRGVFYRQSYPYTVSFDLVDPGGARNARPAHRPQPRQPSRSGPSARRVNRAAACGWSCPRTTRPMSRAVRWPRASCRMAACCSRPNPTTPSPSSPTSPPTGPAPSPTAR